MARVSTEVEVDIELEEFKLNDLLDEIADRHKSCKRDKKEINDWLKSFDFLDIKKDQLSLLDEMKIDFIKRNLDKIKLSDLENLI